MSKNKKRTYKLQIPYSTPHIKFMYILKRIIFKKHPSHIPMKASSFWSTSNGCVSKPYNGLEQKAQFTVPSFFSYWFTQLVRWWKCSTIPKSLGAWYSGRPCWELDRSSRPAHISSLTGGTLMKAAIWRLFWIGVGVRSVRHHSGEPISEAISCAPGLCNWQIKEHSARVSLA